MVEGDHQDPIHHGNTEEWNKANSGGDTEMQTGHVECEDAADDGIRNASERQNRVFEIVEQAVKSTGNQYEADGHDDL